MTLFRLLTIVIATFMGKPISAQNVFNHPMQTGDRVAYRIRTSGITNDSTVYARIVTESANDTASVALVSSRFVAVPGLIFDTWYGSPSKRCTISNGWLMTELSGANWSAMYPVSPPAMDTSEFQRSNGGIVRVIVLRRYSLSIFGVAVQAFDVRLEEYPGVSDLVVADRFGLIAALVKEGDASKWEWRMLNATINGVEYNGESRSFEYLPICAGDVRHYRYSMFVTQDPARSFGRNEIEKIGQDTLVGGLSYFTVRNPVLMGSLYRSAPEGVHVAVGNGSENFFLPSNATIGTVAGHYVVSDTSTVLFSGRMRHRLVLSFEGWDVENSLEWMEGIGLVRSESRSYFGDIESEQLVYASLCGEEHGIPLSTGNQTPAQTDFARFEDLFPNPVHCGARSDFHIVVSASSAVHVQLTLHDVLGRRLATIANATLTPGSHTLLYDGHGKGTEFPPGLYWLRLQTPSSVQAKNLLIIP
jgi:hypothetical protein